MKLTCALRLWSSAHTARAVATSRKTASPATRYRSLRAAARWEPAARRAASAACLARSSSRSCRARCLLLLAALLDTCSQVATLLGGEGDPARAVGPLCKRLELRQPGAGGEEAGLPPRVFPFVCRLHQLSLQPQVLAALVQPLPELPPRPYKGLVCHFHRGAVRDRVAVKR